ncbi:345_t:CDS:2, partial [Dentiscutata heterogama]
NDDEYYGYGDNDDEYYKSKRNALLNKRGGKGKGEDDSYEYAKPNHKRSALAKPNHKRSALAKPNHKRSALARRRH